MFLHPTVLRAYSGAQLRSIIFPVTAVNSEGLTTTTKKATTSVASQYRPLGSLSSSKHAIRGIRERATTFSSGIWYHPHNLKWDQCLPTRFSIEWFSTTACQTNIAVQPVEVEVAEFKSDGEEKEQWAIDSKGVEKADMAGKRSDEGTNTVNAGGNAFRLVRYCISRQRSNSGDGEAFESHVNSVGHEMHPDPQSESEKLTPKPSKQKNPNKKAKTPIENFGLYCKTCPNKVFINDKAARVHCATFDHELSSGPSSLPSFERDLPNEVDPIFYYFSKFPDFDFNAKTSYWDEFLRLCQQKQWKNDGGYDYIRSRDVFRRYINLAFARDIGVSADDIEVWRRIFTTARLKPFPGDVEGCKRVISGTHMNIIDLHESFRGVGRVTTYKDEKKLRRYSQRTQRIFPRNFKGTVPDKTTLGWVLREIDKPTTALWTTQKKYEFKYHKQGKNPEEQKTRVS